MDAHQPILDEWAASVPTQRDGEHGAIEFTIIAATLALELPLSTVWWVKLPQAMVVPGTSGWTPRGQLGSGMLARGRLKTATRRSREVGAW